MIRTTQLEIKVKKNRYHEARVMATLQTLQEMFNDFQKFTTENEVMEHVTRLNGYTAAMVNLDVLYEEEVNTKVRDAIVSAAAARIVQLRERNGRNGN